MLITREALAQPIDPRQVVSHVEKQPPYHIGWTARIEMEGLQILRSASVPELLRELADAIRPTYPDIELEGPRVSETHGTVSLAVDWDFRPREGAPNIVSYNTFSITARLTTGEIVVWILWMVQVLWIGMDGAIQRICPKLLYLDTSIRLPGNVLAYFISR